MGAETITPRREIVIKQELELQAVCWEFRPGASLKKEGTFLPHS